MNRAKEDSPRASPDGGRVGLPKQHVHPGQLVVSRDPIQLVTILGSCVAVCMWDPKCGAGGLAHFSLPEGGGTESRQLRFGTVAIFELVRRLGELGCRAEDLRSKLFGGARVVGAFRGARAHLGLRNVELARRELSRLSIPVLADDVGGNQGRKLVFQTDDGTAWVKPVARI